MKILKIPLSEIPKELTLIGDKDFNKVLLKRTESVQNKLREAGFDLDKPIGSYKGINSFNYLFTQDD